MKTQCVKQMVQWQLQSVSGCICRQKDMTHMANPVITATAFATWHSSGCISVHPASFIPVTVIVTDPHSTKVGLLSHISPFLISPECLS